MKGANLKIYFGSWMFRWIRSKLSMNLVLHNYFTDVVSGETVSVYEDYYGVQYMAYSKFGSRTKMGIRLGGN